MNNISNVNKINYFLLIFYIILQICKFLNTTTVLFDFSRSTDKNFEVRMWYI